MNKITFLLIAGLIFNFSALSQKNYLYLLLLVWGHLRLETGAVNSSIYYRSDIVPSNPPNWDPGIMTNPYGKNLLPILLQGCTQMCSFHQNGYYN
jgi:hypothetical protein